MSSESDRQLSMEELRRRNMQKPPEPWHPTSEEWMELTAALTAMGEIQTEQMLLLSEMAAKPRPRTTSEQTAEILVEAKAIRRLLEQAGKKKERRFSLPKLRLPCPTIMWLVIPAVLLGLLAMCYGWAALSNGLGTLLR